MAWCYRCADRSVHKWSRLPGDGFRRVVVPCKLGWHFSQETKVDSWWRMIGILVRAGGEGSSWSGDSASRFRRGLGAEILGSWKL